MKKIFIQFYSKQNLGDDLFVSILSKRYQDDFISMSEYNNFDLVSAFNLKIHKIGLVSLAIIAFGRIFGMKNIVQNVYMRNCDALIYIGGSIFIEGSRFDRWIMERRFYEKLKKPLYVIGSNIGPYQTKDFIDLVADIARISRDFCLRDKKSYDLVKDVATTRLSTDVAFTLDIEPYTRQLAHTSPSTVVISVIDAYKKFSIDVARKYEDAIKDMTKSLVRQGHKVTLMSFCAFEGDEDAIKSILRELDEVSRRYIDVFAYKGDLEQALSILASSSLIIGSRFHASILGLVFGKPVLPMAYSDKTIDILHDIKFTGPIIDIRDIQSFDVDNIDFNTIPVMDISMQKKIAQTQFQELDKVLTRKQ